LLASISGVCEIVCAFVSGESFERADDGVDQERPSERTGAVSDRAYKCGSELRSALKSVRSLQSVGEILVVLAVLRSAELLDRRQLVLGEVEFALDDIGFA
jgi:hypothetical protein